VRYSGIGDVMENLGQRIDNNQFIATELNWQNQLSNHKDKQKGFQEKVLQSLRFRPFLFMTKGSCFVRMGHSIARHARQEPMAEILPQKAWAWATHKV
jgi:hypothetical protein